MVDGHHGDGVLGVRLQLPQHGGGGGSRHLVLVGERREDGELGELDGFGGGEKGLADAGTGSDVTV